MIVTSLIAALGPIFGQIAKSIFPDPADRLKADELAAKLGSAIVENAAAIEQAAASIVADEAKGQSWLQRNWRPLTMMIFVGLVVAKWLGFTAPGVTEAVELELMRLIQIGLGGYVVGRSIEKIAPTLAKALAK